MCRIVCACAVAATLMFAAVPAGAQSSRPSRPYRGLFASGTADAGQVLSVSGAFAGGWDTDVLADARGGNRVGGSGWSGGLGSLSGGLSYSLQQDELALSASLGTSVRYYPSFAERFLHGESGSFSLSTRLGARVGLALSASASYRPYAISSLFPDSVPSPISEPAVPDLETTIDWDPYASYTADAGLSYRLSNRTSLSAGVNYLTAERSGYPSLDTTSPDFTRSNFSRYGARASLSHGVARGLALRLGYGQNVARYENDREIVNHVIDAGVDYNRALSISRRTTLSFSTGTAITETRSVRRFMLVGAANLLHEIGRSWHAHVGYGRQVHIHEAWLDPVMSDALSAGVGGLLTRRLQFNAGVRGALGKIGVHSDAPGFDAVFGQSSLSFAVTRFMSLGLNYSYYRHQFDEGAALPLLVRSSMDRHSIRASVSLWAPLVTLARRSDASR